MFSFVSTAQVEKCYAPSKLCVFVQHPEASQERVFNGMKKRKNSGVKGYDQSDTGTVFLIMRFFVPLFGNGIATTLQNLLIQESRNNPHQKVYTL